MNSQTEGQSDRRTEIQKDRHTEGQTDKSNIRQTVRRQSYYRSCIEFCIEYVNEISYFTKFEGLNFGYSKLDNKIKFMKRF